MSAKYRVSASLAPGAARCNTEGVAALLMVPSALWEGVMLRPGAQEDLVLGLVDRDLPVGADASMKWL
jgi:hypothetical protein